MLRLVKTTLMAVKMLIKSIDTNTDALAVLEKLKKRSDLTTAQKQAIDKELFTLRTMNKGSHDAAKFLDISFQASEYSILIHDLRLVINGQTAHIDHLLINRALRGFIFDSKHFYNRLKLSESGDFFSWDIVKNVYQTIPSPLTYMPHYIAILQQAFDAVIMPKRLGLKLLPTFNPLILIADDTRFERPVTIDTRCIINIDAVDTIIQQTMEKTSLLDTVSSLTRLVSLDNLQEIGRRLCAMHVYSPPVDYLAQFGLTAEKPKTSTTKAAFTSSAHKTAATPQSSTNPKPTSSTSLEPTTTTLSSNAKTTSSSAVKAAKPTHITIDTLPPTTATAPRPQTSRTAQLPTPKCRRCASHHLRLHHDAQHGFYFVCLQCDGKSTIKLGCGKPGCAEHIRQENNYFFRECPVCQRSYLYYVNTLNKPVKT